MVSLDEQTVFQMAPFWQQAPKRKKPVGKGRGSAAPKQVSNAPKTARASNKSRKAAPTPTLPLRDSSNIRANLTEYNDSEDSEEEPVLMTKSNRRLIDQSDEKSLSSTSDDDEDGGDGQGLQMAQDSGDDEDGHQQEDEDEDEFEEEGGDQTLPPEVPQNPEATKDDHFYSADFGRKLLKVSALKNETMVFNFIVNEVFKDLKFTEGDDGQEMELVRLAYEDGYVKINDPRIALDSFVAEYYTHVAKSVTVLRQRAVSAARKKFQAQLRIDLVNKDKPEGPDAVLPPNLGEILSGVFLRNYTDDAGEVIETRRGAYECYKWFVKNILFCVNFEMTDQLSKQVSDVGYADFISKTYSASDEAFAILLVLNYEHRWRNQVLRPTKNKRELSSNPLYACKWTSSKKGFCKLPWESSGVDKYNDLLGKVEKLRGTPRTGIHLEAMIKKEFEVVKPNRKRKSIEIIEIRPRMGGALQRKLAARNKN